MQIAGYEELRREQAEKRARGELMGIGVSFFTEGVGAGPRKHMDILGLSMNDGADLRVHPSGKAVVASARRRRARATRRRSRRSWPRSSASRRRTSRSATATPTSRPTAWAPTAAARRRSPAAAVAVVSRKVRDKARLIAATMLETRPEDLAWEKGRWYVKGDPEKGAMIEDIAAARLQRRADAGGHGGRARRPGRSTTRRTSPIPTAPTSRSSTSTPTPRRSRCGASSRSTTAACGSTRWSSTARSTAGWPRASASR